MWNSLFLFTSLLSPSSEWLVFVFAFLWSLYSRRGRGREGWRQRQRKRKITPSYCLCRYRPSSLPLLCSRSLFSLSSSHLCFCFFFVFSATKTHSFTVTQCSACALRLAQTGSLAGWDTHQWRPVMDRWLSRRWISQRRGGCWSIFILINFCFFSSSTSVDTRTQTTNIRHTLTHTAHCKWLCSCRDLKCWIFCFKQPRKQMEIHFDSWVDFLVPWSSFVFSDPELRIIFSLSLVTALLTSLLSNLI